MPPWAIGLAIGALLLEGIFRLLNRKEKTPESDWEESLTYDLSEVDTLIEVTWQQRRGRLAWVSCVDGSSAGIANEADVIGGTTGGIGTGFTASGFSGSDVFTPPGGEATAQQFRMILKRQDGSETPVNFANAGGTYPGAGVFGLCGSRGKSGRIMQVRAGGVVVDPPAAERPLAPPSQIPFLGEIGAEPDTQPGPPQLLELLVQQPPEAEPFVDPEALPLARPGFNPRRLAPPGAPANIPQRTVTPERTIEVGPAGPIVRPQPAPIVQTPIDVVVIGGEIIGGPGQAPPPTMRGIAAELGRIERKGEIMMERPPAQPDPRPIQDFLEDFLENELERLVRDLFNNIPGGEYVLTPPCPPPGGGPAAEPVRVPFDEASDPIGSVSNRIDALAMLLQAHKDMRQPICKTPVTGAEVTVHFESD